MTILYPCFVCPISSVRKQSNCKWFWFSYKSFSKVVESRKTAKMIDAKNCTPLYFNLKVRVQIRQIMAFWIVCPFYDVYMYDVKNVFKYSRKIDENRCQLNGFPSLCLRCTWRDWSRVSIPWSKYYYSRHL